MTFVLLILKLLNISRDTHFLTSGVTSFLRKADKHPMVCVVCFLSIPSLMGIQFGFTSLAPSLVKEQVLHGVLTEVFLDVYSVCTVRSYGS